jgi:Major tropism determinant N-terminal domain
MWWTAAQSKTLVQRWLCFLFFIFYSFFVMASKVRIRRGPEANITSATTLELSEIVYADDTGKLFIGDGTGVGIPIKLSLADLIAVYNTANNLVQLNALGKIPDALIPKIAITDVYPVLDIAERDALSPVETGDTAIVTSTSQTFIYDGATWLEMKAPSGVSSVNGQTGAVTLVFDNLDDVNVAGATPGQVLTFDGTNWLAATPTPGVTQFKQLTDVPSSFTGFEGFLVRVKANGTELEFTNEIDGGTI